MEKYLVAVLRFATITRQANADPWVSIKKIWEIAAADGHNSRRSNDAKRESTIGENAYGKGSARRRALRLA